MGTSADELRKQIRAIVDDALAPTYQNKILAATEAIWEKPKDFLNDSRVIELFDYLKNTKGKPPYDRLTTGFPSSMLKDKSKLELLPLPVAIEAHPEITGTNENLMVFDWFPNESGTEDGGDIAGPAREFVEELIKALDKM